jgi:hypothetical protein
VNKGADHLGGECIQSRIRKRHRKYLDGYCILAKLRDHVPQIAVVQDAQFYPIGPLWATTPKKTTLNCRSV